MERKLEVGDNLVPVTHRISTERMVAFESVVWDRGSTAHNDPEAAKTGGMKRPFASGQNTLAFVHEMLERTFEGGWIEGGKLAMRWLRPIYAGDDITVTGRVERVSEVEDRRLVRVDVRAETQNGDCCAAGWAEAFQQRITESQA